MENVYIIEDDDGLRGTLVDLLSTFGYNVQSWSNPAQFLNELPNAAPAVVVTDMRMPELNGVELHAELLRRGRSLPVIYISGESTVSQGVQAMKLGALDFLIKPFAREDLLEAVARGLERDRQKMQELIQRARLKEILTTLSPRELQVYGLLLQGFSNAEIMASLNISLPTAKQYKS